MTRARDDLIERVAKTLRRELSGDQLSEAYLELVKAADKWISTGMTPIGGRTAEDYCYVRARRAATRFESRQPVVSIPRYAMVVHNGLIDARIDLEAALDRTPTLDDLADETGFSVPKIAHLLDMVDNVVDNHTVELRENDIVRR